MRVRAKDISQATLKFSAALFANFLRNLRILKGRRALLRAEFLSTNIRELNATV
jgi:hypothetical protein